MAHWPDGTLVNDTPETLQRLEELQRKINLLHQYRIDSLLAFQIRSIKSTCSTNSVKKGSEDKVMPQRSAMSLFNEGRTLEEIGTLANFGQRVIDLVGEGGFVAKGAPKKRAKRRTPAQMAADAAKRKGGAGDGVGAGAGVEVAPVIPSATRAPAKKKRPASKKKAVAKVPRKSAAKKKAKVKAGPGAGIAVSVAPVE